MKKLLERLLETLLIVTLILINVKYLVPLYRNFAAIVGNRFAVFSAICLVIDVVLIYYTIEKWRE